MAGHGQCHGQCHSQVAGCKLRQNGCTTVDTVSYTQHSNIISDYNTVCHGPAHDDDNNT